MPQKSNHPQRLAGASIARVIAALLLVCFLQLSAALAVTQRTPRRTRPAAPAQPQQAQSTDNANAGKPQRPKRVFVGGASSTAQGSRLTIKSDNPLNDYSAYRSGDRFYVVLPKAEADAIAKGGGGGRGYSDMQVQRRGNDVVLSYRLQPGAKPRVEQKFNRLDVVFDTAEGGATENAGTSAPNVTPQAQQGQHGNAASAQSQANAAAQNQAAQRVEVPALNQGQAANAAERNQIIGGNGGAAGEGALPYGFATGTAPAVPPVGEQTPVAAPSVAPTAEQQIAQAQSPAEAGRDTAVTTTDGTAAQPVVGTTIGAVILRNWPVALIIALVLGGIGLFWAARRSSRKDESVAVESPLSAEPETLEEAHAETLADVPADSVPESETAETVIASTTPASIFADEAANDLPWASRLNATVDDDETVAVVDATTAGAENGASSVESPASAVTDDETLAVVPAGADAENVQAETRRLLDGEPYNKSIIGATDIMTRQMVAAELLAALAGRNAERRDRARRAFVEHGYFNETAHDLRFAAAPAERASAARSLALVGDRSAASHLIAALEDETVEVRRAAVEALAELRTPQAIEPLRAMFDREKHGKNRVPRKLIERAIDSCSTEVEAQTETAEETAPAAHVEADEAVAPASLISGEATTTTSPVDEASPAAEPAPFEEAAPVEEAASAHEEVAPSHEEVESVIASLEDEPMMVEPQEEVAASADAPEEVANIEPAVIDEAEDEVSAAPVAEEETPVVEEAASPAELFVAEQQDEAETLVADAPAPVVADVAQPTVEELAPRAEELAEETLAPAPLAASATTFADESPAHVEEPAHVAEELHSEESFSPVAEELPEPEEVPTTPVAETAFEEEDETHVELEAPVVERVDVRENATEVAEVATPEAEVETLASFAPLAGAEELTEPEVEHDETSFALSGSQTEERAADVWTPPVTHAEVETPQFEFGDVDTMPRAESHAPVKEIEFAGDAAVADEEWVEFNMDEAEDVPAVEPHAASFESREHHESSITGELFEPVEDVREVEIVSSPQFEETIETPAARGPETTTEKGIEVFDEHSAVPKAIQLRLASDDQHERASALGDLASVDSDEAFHQVCACFDDESREVRAAAARALYNLKGDRADSFTRALREADPERRRNIGAAINSSGLASEAISQLTGESRDKTYEAFSLLFLMAKAGEVQPLIRAIEGHPDNEVRLAVVKLLALSGQKDILPAFRRLAVRGSLPTEVRSAVMEAIYQISSGQSDAPSAA